VVDFRYTGGASGAQFQWDFGPGSVPESSTLRDPVGVTFPGAGERTILLRVGLGDCLSEAATYLITLGRPRLEISRSGTNGVVWWSGDGFVLEETPALGLDAVWTPVTTLPEYVGGRYSLKVSLENRGRFFRLRER
jgi:hypothetical protein